MVNTHNQYSYSSYTQLWCIKIITILWIEMNSQNILTRIVGVTTITIYLKKKSQNTKYKYCYELFMQ